MTTRSAERAGRSVGLVAALGGLLLGLLGAVIPPNSFVSSSRAAQPGVEPNAKSGPVGGLGYLKSEPTEQSAGKINSDILGCQSCHSGADTPGAKPFVAALKSPEFVLLNESVTWDQKDIHAAALKCLSEDLGKQMEKVLKKYRGPDYSVTTAAECLVCHGADLSPKKPLADKKVDDFDLAPGGVTCTVCHGFHNNWQIAHYVRPKAKEELPPWRAMMPAEKYSQGMRDLRNPVVKAVLCASCHVGSPAEGKVVTHEMYAAGHPPLPPFELASYMEGEPKHWGYPAELKYFERVKAGDTWKLYHFHPADKESYLTRHYAIGAVASLRAEAELLLADATLAGAKHDILDFARFDCYACHHELHPGGERQQRGYDGAPGRTPLRAAAGVPVGVVAKHAEGIDAGGLKAKAVGFEDKWLALKKAALAKQFGDPDKIKETAPAVIAWCDAFLQVQSETDEPLYPAAQATRLREMLTQTALGRTATADPEAAMCLAWGARTLAREAKAFPADEMKDMKVLALGGILPLNVRMEPYSKKGMDDALVPERAKYADRMKKIAVFESSKFVDAFKNVFPMPK